MVTTMILTIVMICCLPSHNRMCSNCWKLQKKERRSKISKKEEEKNPWCCRRKISYWPCSFHSVCDIQQKNLWTHICTTWENKYLSIYHRHRDHHRRRRQPWELDGEHNQLFPPRLKMKISSCRSPPWPRRSPRSPPHSCALTMKRRLLWPR